MRTHILYIYDNRTVIQRYAWKKGRRIQFDFCLPSFFTKSFAQFIGCFSFLSRVTMCSVNGLLTISHCHKSQKTWILLCIPPLTFFHPPVCIKVLKYYPTHFELISNNLCATIQSLAISRGNSVWEKDETKTIKQRNSSVKIKINFQPSARGHQHTVETAYTHRNTHHWMQSINTISIVPSVQHDTHTQ